MTALFGILQLDRGEPMGYSNLIGLFQAWCQDAGGFAAVGLTIYLLYVLLGERSAGASSRMSESNKLRMPVTTWMVAMFVLSLICYGGVLAMVMTGRGAPPAPALPQFGLVMKHVPPVWHSEPRPLLLMAAGLFALLGIGEPFVRDLFKIRGRRVWALAQLGFKEALRFRIHWALIALVLLPFLTRSVWMSSTKPTDEFRVLIVYITFWFTICLLVTGAIISAFSLPNDIKNYTIHTVVTKPVQRFEVVLGRFLGYAGLMTMALVIMTAINVILINSSTIDPKAEREAAKARVPIRGKLEFASRKDDFEGTNVGREFDYRRYISPNSSERAIWNFATVPSALKSAEGNAVPIEFTFDVFKLTKGVENQGVLVTFRFVTHNCPQIAPKPGQRGEWQWGDKPGEPYGSGEIRKRAYEADLAALPKGTVTAKPGTPGWEAMNKLAEKHGFYEIREKEVFDYAVMNMEVPAGLFRNAAEGDPGTFEGKDGQMHPRPRFSIYVKCESGGQLLGMAEPDLYLLEANQPFTINFIKGMFGLWCRLCILIGLAIACSTYLSGVLSLLIASGIFILGYFSDHMNDLANGRNVGGGPFQTISQLMKAESPTTPFGDSSSDKALLFVDRFHAWVVRRLQNVIPDVESFTWTNFVSEGFNINGEYLLVNLLMMVGYLLPWAVLAYYLMKTREVA
ncbi:MAG TPA: ABC transporter permease, partial [Urbifossiella sp.]